MKRLTMRKIREALRLHASGLSTRKIAASLGVGQSTASDYLKRVERTGLSWPLAAEITDAALEACGSSIGAPRLVEANGLAAIHRGWAPGRDDVVLWEEYARSPRGYGYSALRSYGAGAAADAGDAPHQSQARDVSTTRHDAGGNRRRRPARFARPLFVRPRRRMTCEANGPDAVGRIGHCGRRIFRRGSGAGGVRQPEVGVTRAASTSTRLKASRQGREKAGGGGPDPANRAPRRGEWRPDRPTLDRNAPAPTAVLFAQG